MIQELTAVQNGEALNSKTKAVQWLYHPKQARIGRILEKFKDQLPPCPPSGWYETWSAVFEGENGIISEWPLKQFHEVEIIEFDRGVFLLKGYLNQEAQLSLVKTYREELQRNKVRMTPPSTKNQAGTTCFGWRKQGKKYVEPKLEIPDLLYDLSQLAIKLSGKSLPLLEDKQNCSALVQPLNCYQTENIEIPLHVELVEHPSLFGRPLIIFNLGCKANFLCGSSEGFLIESGDCILLANEWRLMPFGIGEVIPLTEPEYFSNLPVPLKGHTSITVQQVKQP